MKQQYDRDSMSSDKSSKTNKSSMLLSQEENELVFSMLGRKCQVNILRLSHFFGTPIIIRYHLFYLLFQTQFTSVVQLFTTSAPAHSHWIKRHTGVLCFVKDSSKRSYFCRLYCLVRGELVWEQEMYDSIEIIKPRAFLLTFEGQEGVIAFNFVSEDETDGFCNVVKTTMANRNRRREGECENVWF
jgi:neural Wiskott-Aldrich syndrome protein